MAVLSSRSKWLLQQLVLLCVGCGLVGKSNAQPQSDLFTLVEFSQATIVAPNNSFVTLPCTAQTDNVTYPTVTFLQISWYRNGLLINFMRGGYYQGIQRLNKSEYAITSQLGILSVNQQTAGVFSCTARGQLNDGYLQDLSAWHNTTTVRVAVAPVITGDTQVTFSEGSTATLWCNATGVPQPSLEWWTEDNSTRLAAKNFSSLTQDHSSLSLTVFMVHRDDSGKYECRASNMAGITRKTQELFVHYKPIITEISESQLVPVRTNLLLTCKASGYPAPQVTWLHHRHNLSVVDRLVLSHARDGSLYGLESDSNVTTARVLTTDGGQYTCVASNDVGHQRRHVQITVQTEPDAPALKQESDVMQTTISVSWTEPDFHNSSIVDYDVQVRDLDNGAGGWQNVTVEDSVVRTRSAMACNLDPFTRYAFRVRALNAIGYSDYSNPLELQTQPLEPAQLEDVTAVAQPSGTTVEISWRIPNDWNMSMGVFRRVVLLHRILAFQDELQRTEFNVTARNATSGTVELRGLAKGTQYSISVLSNNGFFDSQPVTVTPITGTTIPGNATMFTVTPLSHERLSFDWTGIDDGGTPLTRLMLSYKYLETPDDQQSWQEVASGDLPLLTDHTVVMGNFSADTAYRFKLTTRNAKGKGRPSSFANVQTPPFQYPPNVEIANIMPTAITAVVQWRVLGVTPLVPVEMFEVQWRTETSLATSKFFDATPGRFDGKITGLPRDTRVYITIRAHNEYGAALNFSDDETVKTEMGLPGVPLELLVLGSSHDSANISWKVNLDEEFPATQLIYNLVLDGGQSSTVDYLVNVTANAGVIFLKGLSPTASYSARVYASNANGRSTSYRLSNFLTSAAPTTPPPTPFVTSTLGEGEKSDSNQIVVIIGASVGGGVLVILVVVVALLLLKSRRSRQEQFRLQEVQKGNWRANSVKNPTSPIAERTDGSFHNTPIHRDPSAQKSWLQKSDSLVGADMYEADRVDGTPKVDEGATFTSFTVTRTVKEDQVATWQEADDYDKAYALPSCSPPSTPPPPPLTPAAAATADGDGAAAPAPASNYEYTTLSGRQNEDEAELPVYSKPFKATLHGSVDVPAPDDSQRYSKLASRTSRQEGIDHDHDLAGINQTNTFQPLIQDKKNTVV